MSHEQDGLEGEVRGGKSCLHHGSNNPEHPKPSCDDPGECAGDNGGKDKTQIQSKYNILPACLAGTDLLTGAASQPIFSRPPPR